MLLHHDIRGRMGPAVADNVADYFERLARDLRLSADDQRERDQRQTAAAERIALAHALAPSVQDDIEHGELTENAIATAAQHYRLAPSQLAAWFRQHQIDQARARREYRDIKIIQLVKRKWSNAAVARELARLGYIVHPATVTRVWKRHLKLRE